jgi:hypothetical protein
MKIRTAFLIACLALVGCGRPPRNSPTQHYTYQAVSYWRDSRSDTCYAVIEAYYGGDYVSTTTESIPCTDKVIALTNYFSND